MCSHYQALKEQDKYRRYFGVEPPADLYKFDMWPGYLGAFIRRHPHADVGDEAVSPREALTGLFGMVPHWAQDAKIARHTFNARSETVAEKPSFRDAWRKGHRCIIPAEAFFEPDWRSGKAVPTLIARADGEPLGIAGLWSAWKSPKGEWLHSYTMLTINADQHPLMRMFHKPTDEKRMVVILPPDRYQDWLEAPVEHGMEFMRPFPAEALHAMTPFQTKIQQECPPAHQHKVRRLTEFCLQFDGEVVPDPYYGSAKGFEHVLDLVEDASDGLIQYVKQQPALHVKKGY